jgi:hypothetical protein
MKIAFFFFLEEKWSFFTKNDHFYEEKWNFHFLKDTNKKKDKKNILLL